ncbi:tetratricopeptide repeat protein [Algibacter sp. 2305UL17-15]|uniref:tetratricopeptide repeat protein n=1 Tax=Algibacter sp. 2305UL17-15 TaxID=3231268 RepID=UPI00345758AB
MPKEAKRYLDSFTSIANTCDEEKYIGQIARYTGNYYKAVSNYEEAAKYYSKAIAHYNKIGNKKQTHRNLRYLSHVQRRLGRYEDAMQSAMRSLKEKELIGMDSLDLAVDYITVGNIHGELKNYKLSNTYFKKAIAVYTLKNKKSQLANAYMNAGINFNRLKEHDSALTYYYKSKYIYKDLKREEKLPLLYINIGVAHSRTKNSDSAEYYYKKALALSEKFNLIANISLSSNNLGYLERKKGNHKKAIAYFTRALKIAEKSKMQRRIALSSKNISSSYAALNNYPKAYEFMRLYSKINDSLYPTESLERINKLEVQYQTEKKETELLIKNNEIKSLNQKIEIGNLTKIAFAIGMFSCIAIAALLYFGFKQRIKKNKIEREKQQTILKQEIEFKKKELASQTLHLVQKNTFIQELKVNLEKIKKSPELFKVEFRRLVMLLKKESAEDKDWEVFKSYFSEVHNNFDHKLKAVYEDINEKEMRLASYLRMNLSTKEIASLLNVLPESVLKSKYRLKKKLGLDKDIDLNQFLSDL